MRRGRPRRREETTQFSLYLESREVPELLGAKGEDESTTSYLEKATRTFAALMTRARSGCKQAAAALALVGALDGAAMEVQDDARTVVAVGAAAAQDTGAILGRVLPAPASSAASGEPTNHDGGAGVLPARSAFSAQSPQHQPRIDSPALLGGASTSALQSSAPAVAPRRPDPRPIPVEAAILLPPKPRFPARAYEEGRGVEISRLRKTIWEQFPNELAKADEAVLELNEMPCASEAWVESYAAHLARFTREYADDPIEETPAPPPQLTPEEELTLWYRTERDKIERSTRSILIANDKLKDLQAEYQRRRRAQKEGPS